MAKDNITYPSLITLGKISSSVINKDVVDKSVITDDLVFDSPIGIEDEAPIPPVYPPIIDDGNSKFWGITRDLSTITKDASDFTSVFMSQLGLPVNLLQALGSSQPLWTPEGLLFDSISHFMKTLGFTFNQPEMVYIVFKQVTWSINRRIFDGFNNVSMLLNQGTVTPSLRMYAGSFSANNSNLAVGTFGIGRFLFNGANSTSQINETTKWTGNVGASNAGGFTLGAQSNGGNPSNILVSEIILREINETVQNQQDIYDYLELNNGL